jgi:hypothetical protein
VSSILPAHFGDEGQAKGHARYGKHVRQKESDQYKYSTEGSNVDLQTSEERWWLEPIELRRKLKRIIDSERGGDIGRYITYICSEDNTFKSSCQLFFKARLQSQASHKACMTGLFDRQTFQLSLVLRCLTEYHAHIIVKRYLTSVQLRTRCLLKLGVLGISLLSDASAGRLPKPCPGEDLRMSSKAS